MLKFLHKQKLLSISLLFIFSMASYGQKEALDWPEKMIIYYSQNPEKCILLIDQVLASHHGEYSQREAKALAIGAYAYVKKDKKKASHVAALAFKPLAENLLSNGNDFSKLNKNQKKQYIKNFSESYEAFVGLYALIDNNDSIASSKINELVDFFHENIFAYRNIFDASIPNEALMIASIIRQEIWYFMLRKRYDALLLNLYPELIELHSDGNQIVDISIFATLELIKNDIVEFGFTEMGKNYLEERTNFLLHYNELGLYNSGLKIAEQYGKSKWSDVKQSLDNDECAVLMYDYNLFSINLLSAVVISPYSNKPQDLSMHMGNSSPENFIKSLEKEYPNCKRFYICPLGKWENVDVAYDNPKIHIKHSLFDLSRFPKTQRYNNGIISIFADINYGEKKDLDYFQPLKDGKLIIDKAQELFGNKVYCLSGNRVQRINFLNVIDDVSIFHVSTHGKARPVDISPKDTLDFYNSFVGNTSMLGYGLALSKFNENNSQNFISAKDIKNQVKFTGNQIAYLDACETGQSHQSFFGPNGLAKSFYFAGAKNVIAYITEINEKVATDFALAFYYQLHETPNESYHNIFYKVKKQIIQKYSNFLSKDDFGRPNLGILLWE